MGMVVCEYSLPLLRSIRPSEGVAREGNPLEGGPT